MTTPEPHPGAVHGAPGHDPHGARSEEDRIDSGAIVVVGVASLLLFFLASLVAVSFFTHRMAERGPITIPPEIGQSKIGLVEQQQFGLVVRGERSRARDLERLGSFGWVDQRAGLAHIPIDEAMRLVVGGLRAAPVAPVPGETTKPEGGQP
jgi:hypothetical protein